ncbi:MAG: ATP synthase F1 subunit epsilon [Candidatus Nealsonbacteria bacterium CG08_land_8_20_14_0_20_38_20]|uniref:ATP synthase F1 subunit epsilon n=1 Tax=Candidatus Nealsonbacteria bacterium CG08_land_8_20_14_0_20_38_20 TaxID=1974705 RepID=A0A2H0YLA4_9BACT|nr:MAG: ATP synthase F1 subunit epsilon [Candidatus Nealsonbacteria bacterium CG08_land_8_20_14_0_20_38_20]
MLVNIINLEKIIYSDETDEAILPGKEGQLTILPNHAPLVALLKKGKIKLRKKGGEKIFEIDEGILEVNPKEVNVLVIL